MGGTGEWTMSRSASGDIERCSLFQDGQALPFGRYFDLLQNEKGFARWYTEELKGSPFSAYFWEHPPLVTSNIDSHAEFVLVNAPLLESFHQNTAPFRSYFADNPVVSFRNIGGDAMLVAPSPVDGSADYAHLATFLRTAPESQVQALWQMVARSVADSLADKPLWLSTSGLGVAWLHVRLDSVPKYYQYQPYKRWPAAGRPGES